MNAIFSKLHLFRLLKTILFKKILRNAILGLIFFPSSEKYKHKVHQSVSLTRMPYVIREHQSSRLNDELVRLFVPDDSRRQTCGGAGFPAGVHRSGRELLHVPEHKRPRYFLK